MIGAGLSFSANPMPGVTSRFPTWRQLARVMLEQLYPEAPDGTSEQTQRRNALFVGSNPLRVASEYEAAFGRGRLESLIREQVPDADYQPGSLHGLLLELPWGDIFTTNYDTLLERTEVRGRNYQPVVKVEDLTAASAPRIVKLHGSLPSKTSFIISEEDYRTYPRKFAPFVNSVQQALLENSLVLLGFSGDDPNFLEWTGWIRDELGENHPPIYLVGPLELGSAQRLLLGRRGVTPIDLSPVFAGYTLPEGIHRASIEWFLRSLAAAQPPRPEKWPDFTGFSEVPPADKPSIVVDATKAPTTVDFHPKPNQSIGVPEISAVVARWKFERDRYPGWLIATESQRSSLWLNTKYWLVVLTNATKELPAADRLRVFREINWRLETALVPLFSSWIEHFEQALNESADAVVWGESLAQSLPEPVSSDEIADAWLELAFGLLREARESYDSSRWAKLRARIDQVVLRRPRYRDRNIYEEALWALWNADHRSAKSVIDRWQVSAQVPLSGLWKAGLLAEIDEIGEARTLLRSVLSEIRRSLRHHGKNIALLSLEGWCTYVLFGVETVSAPSRYRAIRNEFWERWQELKAWDCSPWPVKEYFEEALKSAPPSLPKEHEEVHGFDPAHSSTVHHWIGDTAGPFLPAFGWIRMYEQAGIPMRLRNLDLGRETLRNACRWIKPFITFWSPALLIRVGKVEDLEKGELLDRSQVAAMDSALAGRLYNWCLQIFEREVSGLTGLVAYDSAQEGLLEILPEVLSRLAFRVSDSDLKRTFPLVQQFYRAAGIRAHIRLHDSSSPWFRRLFHAADSALLLQWLPHLIRAPLFEAGTPDVIPDSHAWPDPMDEFPVDRIRDMDKTDAEAVARIGEATDWLLKRAQSETGEARHRALLRFSHIHTAQIMTDEQRQQFGELLWAQRGPNGLPSISNFAAFGYLHAPAPKGLDVAAYVKNYVLSLPADGFVKLDSQGRAASISEGIGFQPLIYEAALATKPVVQLAGEALGAINWSPEESASLYAKARTWWENDKKAFELEARIGPFMAGNPVRRTLNKLGDFLTRCVLPDLAPDDDARRLEIQTWLNEVRQVGIYPSIALPYFLLQRPDLEGAISAILLEDLRSDVADSCEAAARALRHWASLAGSKKIPNLPGELVQTLINRVAFRRTAGLLGCTSYLVDIIVEEPQLLSGQHRSLLATSLIAWNSATLVTIADQNSEFARVERPDLRAAVARMAGALSRLYRTEATLPTPIAFWRDASAADPLPEVRRAYRFWSERD